MTKVVEVGKCYKNTMLLTPDDGVQIGLEAHQATIGDIKKVLNPLTPEEKKLWAENLLELDR